MCSICTYSECNHCTDRCTSNIHLANLSFSNHQKEEDVSLHLDKIFFCMLIISVVLLVASAHVQRCRRLNSYFPSIPPASLNHVYGVLHTVHCTFKRCKLVSCNSYLITLSFCLMIRHVDLKHGGAMSRSFCIFLLLQRKLF